MNGWPQLAAFNGFDWVVVVIVTLSALISIWRGFVREALSLAGWVVAFVVANLAAMTVAEAIGDLIANRTGRYIVAWSLLFAVVLVVSSLTAKLVSKMIAASGLGILDRMLGTIFGVCRGMLIVMALVFVVREVIPRSELDLLSQSELMPHIDVLLSWTVRNFEEFRDVEIPGINV